MSQAKKAKVNRGRLTNEHAVSAWTADRWMKQAVMNLDLEGSHPGTKPAADAEARRQKRKVQKQARKRARK